MDSIFLTVKKLCNVSEDDTSFDSDLIIHINTVLMILRQIGIGNDMVVEDENATWDELLSGYEENLSAVKTYVPFKVRMLFDPPQQSSFKESLKESIAELEWRLNITDSTMEVGD